MKKFFLFILAVAATVTLTGCSSAPAAGEVPSDPGKAAVYYFEFAKKADFDSFLDGFYFGPHVTPEMISFGKEMIKQSFTNGNIDNAEMENLSKLGIKLIDSHSHGDSEAHVTLELTNSNGEAEEATFDMKKIEGVWKMVVPM